MAQKRFRGLVFISPAVALNNSAVALDQRAICGQLGGQTANYGAKALEPLLLEPDDGSWNQNMISVNCSVVSYTERLTVKAANSQSDGLILKWPGLIVPLSITRV